jgi:hypothetical protein
MLMIALADRADRSEHALVTQQHSAVKSPPCLQDILADPGRQAAKVKVGQVGHHVHRNSKHSQLRSCINIRQGV